MSFIKDSSNSVSRKLGIAFFIALISVCISVLGIFWAHASEGDQQDANAENTQVEYYNDNSSQADNAQEQTLQDAIATDNQLASDNQNLNETDNNNANETVATITSSGGETQDFDTLQDAINALVTGDTLNIVKAGDYEKVNFPSSTTLMENVNIVGIEGAKVAGIGIGKAKIKNIAFKNLTLTDAINFTQSLMNEFETDGVVVENCTYNGPSTESGTGSNMLIYVYAFGGTFKDLTVKDCVIDTAWQGMYLAGVENITVDNCEIKNTGHNAVALQRAQGGSSTVFQECKGQVNLTNLTLSNIDNRAFKFDTFAGTNINIQNNDFDFATIDPEGSEFEIAKGASAVTAYTVTYQSDLAMTEGTSPIIVGGTVVLKQAEGVCKIGSTIYNSLEEAIAASQTGDTIIFYGAQTLNSDATLKQGTTLKFDAGGKITVATGKTLSLAEGANMLMDGAKQDQLVVGGTLSATASQVSQTVETSNWKISYGTFTFDPSTYVADNFKAKETAGSYVIKYYNQEYPTYIDLVLPSFMNGQWVGSTVAGQEDYYVYLASNETYYKYIKDALADSTDNDTIYIKPNCTVPYETSHSALVKHSFTLYGNGSYWETLMSTSDVNYCDFNITNTATTLSADTTININGFCNYRIWGTNNFGDIKIYINQNQCIGTGDTYLGGTETWTSLNYNNCYFKNTYWISSRFQAFGEVNVTNTTYEECASSININQESSGAGKTLSVKYKDCNFINCGIDYKDARYTFPRSTGSSFDWMAPITIKNTTNADEKITATIDNCTFSNDDDHPQCNFDIALGYGYTNDKKNNYPVECDISNTDGVVQFQRTREFGKDIDVVAFHDLDSSKTYKAINKGNPDITEESTRTTDKNTQQPTITFDGNLWYYHYKETDDPVSEWRMLTAVGEIKHSDGTIEEYYDADTMFAAAQPGETVLIFDDCTLKNNVTIDGITVISEGKTITVNSGAKLTINQTGTEATSIFAALDTSGEPAGTIEINGGTFNSDVSDYCSWQQLDNKLLRKITENEYNVVSAQAGTISGGLYKQDPGDKVASGYSVTKDEASNTWQVGKAGIGNTDLNENVESAISGSEISAEDKEMLAFEIKKTAASGIVEDLKTESVNTILDQAEVTQEQKTSSLILINITVKVDVISFTSTSFVIELKGTPKACVYVDGALKAQDIDVTNDMLAGGFVTVTLPTANITPQEVLHSTNTDELIEVFKGQAMQYDPDTQTVTVAISRFSKFRINATVLHGTITYNANGGTGQMADQCIEFGAQTVLSANTFTKQDYNFASWNTAADGTGTKYNNGDTVMLAADTTLYAQWSKAEPTPTPEPVVPGGATTSVKTASTGDSSAVPLAMLAIIGVCALVSARLLRRNNK